ncbi:MAG: hypothetical protein ACQESC_03110 [Nanobdellota archaeon]
MMEVHITYETLFDLLRKERSLEELQSLDSSFWKYVIDYIQDRKSTLDSSRPGEQEKIKVQLQNIKRILKEIYERRERKIINLALNVIRSDAMDYVDTKNMLAEEKSLFNEALTLFKKYKSNVLLNVFDDKLPAVVPEIPSKSSSNMSSETDPTSTPSATGSKSELSTQSEDPSPESSSEPFSNSSKKSSSHSTSDVENSSDSDLKKKQSYFSNGDFTPDTSSSYFQPDKNDGVDLSETDVGERSKDDLVDGVPKDEIRDDSDNAPQKVIVKFVSAVPKFYGKNKNIFGPYSEGQIVTLPSNIASILLKKGKAKNVMK